jgi:RNA polymerase sigma factor (sigma-70 family)
MELVLPDVDCLARSLSEPEAFELIFERHFDAIHKYLHQRVGRDLADEIAAETFASAFERRASCRAGDSALPWLYGIATNLLRRRFRTERRQLRAYARRGVDRGVVYEDEAEARPDGSSFGARLASALAAMRPRERDALLLYALSTSATTRSRLPSMRPSGRCARGFTGHGGQHNASSPQKRTLSLSRHQELS